MINVKYLDNGEDFNVEAKGTAPVLINDLVDIANGVLNEISDSTEISKEELELVFIEGLLQAHFNDRVPSEEAPEESAEEATEEKEEK